MKQFYFFIIYNNLLLFTLLKWYLFFILWDTFLLILAFFFLRKILMTLIKVFYHYIAINCLFSAHDSWDDDFLNHLKITWKSFKNCAKYFKDNVFNHILKKPLYFLKINFRMRFFIIYWHLKTISTEKKALKKILK